MLAAYRDKNVIEAGCDEAGRGCLAGPVFAAAVIMPRDFFHPLLKDSKQLPEISRSEARKIVEMHALAWAVAQVGPEKIDAINILNASLLAMHKAIGQLSITPQSLLIDGNRFRPFRKIPHHCIVKGDRKYLSIAAASILAKTYRDAYMYRIAQDYPCYHWEKNKGYPTREHRRAILVHGPSPHHRRTFRFSPPDPGQGKLF